MLSGDCTPCSHVHIVGTFFSLDNSKRKSGAATRNKISRSVYSDFVSRVTVSPHCSNFGLAELLLHISQLLLALNPSGKHAQNLYQTGHPVIGSGFKFHLKYVKLYNVNFLAVNLPSPPNCCEVHVQRPVRAFLHGDVLAKPAVLQRIPTRNSPLGANEAETQRIFLKHHNMI